MRATLEDFFKALRGSGLDVALDAQIDASRALTLVGWRDRELLRDALRATLVKSLPDGELFDECFARFFSFTAFRDWSIARADSAANPAAAEPTIVDNIAVPPAPTFARDGEAAGLSTLAGLSLGGDGTDSAALSKRLREAAREIGLTDIWVFAQKGHYTQRLLRQMGVATLDRAIAEAAAQTPEPAELPALRQARQRLFAEARQYVEQQLALYGRAPTQQLHDDFLRAQPLSAIERRDFQRMHEIVRQIARRLAARHARRRRRQLRGRLDFRKTLRRNATHGGLLFETFWREEVVDRPRVIAICDVSGSVRAHARFLLLFLYSLNELIADIRSFAFTNHLVDVSATFAALPVEPAVDKIIAAVGGRGTDYGGMFLDVAAQVLPKVDRKTTVLILGDARNNHGEPRAEVLESLYRRSRRVIWLNPETRALWGQGDSEMRRYLPFCHIARECATLRQLERVMDDLLRGG
jgi:uncharacterized protein with von Willebrand factor type A (vWA) domain